MKYTSRSILLLASLVLVTGCTDRVRPTPSTKDMTGITLTTGDRVVFFGDSITEAGVQPGGYVTLLQERAADRFPDGSVELLGAGISGNKVPDLLQRVDSDVYSLDPTVVVIYIGTNDVWHWLDFPQVIGTTEEDFETGLLDLIGGFKGRDIQVLLCTPAVIGERPHGQNEADDMLDRYVEIQRDVAAASGATFCDLRERFLTHLSDHNPDGVDRGILTTDGVHLNAAGNRFVAEQMGAFLGLD